MFPVYSFINCTLQDSTLKINHFTIDPRSIHYIHDIAITKDSIMYCEFCKDVLEIKMRPSSRQWNAPKVPHIIKCDCEGMKIYTKLFQDKARFLSSRNQKGWAVYKDKLYYWGINISPNPSRCKEFTEFIMHPTFKGQYKDIWNIKIQGTIILLGSEKKQNIFNLQPECNYPFQDRNIDIQLQKYKDIALQKVKEIQFKFGQKQCDYSITTTMEKLTPKEKEFYTKKYTLNIDGKGLFYTKDKEEQYIRLDKTDTVLALNILKFCDLRTIGNLTRANKRWNRICSLDEVWKQLIEMKFPFEQKELNFGGYKEHIHSFIHKYKRPALIEAFDQCNQLYANITFEKN